MSGLRACIHALALFAVLWFVSPAFAQTPVIDMEGSVPANWTTSSGSLAISNKHYKVNTQSLEWNWTAGSVLTVNDANFTAGPYYCSIWIHNPVPVPGQKLVFQFKDASGTTQYTFNYYLDYSGWRRAIRDYATDMQGPRANPNIASVVITGPTSGSGRMYLDQVVWLAGRYNWAKNKPNNDATVDGGCKGFYYDPYWNWLPDIPATPPTPQEVADLNTIRQRWIAGTEIPNPSSSRLPALYDYITNPASMNIVIDGNEISGKVQSAGYYHGFGTTNIKELGGHVFWTGDTTSADYLSRYAWYWLDQGLDADSDWCTASNGSDGSTIWTGAYNMDQLGFIFGANGFTPEMRLKMWNMMRWLYRIGDMWNPNWKPGDGDMDWLNQTLSLRLGSILFLAPDDATSIQWLKGHRRFCERFFMPGNGNAGGMKADGTGFHHGGYYPSYLVGVADMLNNLWYLRETSLGITEEGYRHLRNNMVSDMHRAGLTSGGGAYLPNSTAGRSPFAAWPFCNNSNFFRQWGVEGGRALGLSGPDPVMARLYNSYWPNEYYAPFASFGPEQGTEQGFFQSNYAMMGTYRRGTWVAEMRGMNNAFWGAECYGPGENSYGRYQSFGVCEILYQGGMGVSGYGGKGWNWNHPPGGTTIAAPWTSLKAWRNYNLVQDKNFAGSLAFRGQGGLAGAQAGVTACDFAITWQYDAPSVPMANLYWKKSDFCFGNYIIRLASDMDAPGSTSPVVTTLFQANLGTNVSKPTVLNGGSTTAFPSTQTDNGAAVNWLVDSVGTGYFVRPGTPLNLTRSVQTTPDQNDDPTNTASFGSGNFATAWLDHGNTPNGSGYEYVVVPGTTTAAMRTVAAQLDDPGTSPYEVLQKNAAAHVLRWKPDGTIGYALFASGNVGSEAAAEGALRSVNRRCLVMTRPTPSGNLWLSLSYPDLGGGFNGPETIAVTLAGQWALLNSPTNAVVSSMTPSSTTLSITVEKGMPADLELQGSILGAATTNAAPVIATHPASQTIPWSESVTFSVGVSGTPPFTCQWKKGGTDIPGATGLAYTIAATSSSDAGDYHVVITNAYGSATSNIATLTIADKRPTFTTQPADRSVHVGEPVTFSAALVGSMPMTYQWKKNGVNISGATNASLTINAASLSDAGGYAVQVTNVAGSTISRMATLNVVAVSDMLLWYKLNDATGTTALDSSGRGNHGTLNGPSWSGDRGGSLSFDGTDDFVQVPTAALSGLGNEITISFWALGDSSLPKRGSIVHATDSANKKLISINLPWGNGWVKWDAGQWVGLTWYDRLEGHAANGEYKGRWRHWAFTKNTTTGNMTIYLDGAVWRSSTGNTQPMVSLVHDLRLGRYFDPTPGEGAAYYHGTLSDLRIYKREFQSPDVQMLYSGNFNAVTVAVDPESTEVESGTSVTLNATVTGTAPLSYQWYDPNQNPIAGATGTSYTFTATASTAGTYTLVAVNAAGLGSGSSLVTIAPPPAPPSILTQPASLTRNDGAAAAFSVTVSGAKPMSFQWRKDGVTIAGATAASYSIPSVSSADAGSYSVVISNVAGTATSSSATLTVNTIPPSITTQPVSQTVVAGNTVTFSVAASGSQPMSYQWTKGGANIPGATAATYSIPGVTASHAGNYAVVFTNPGGTATSNTAVLTVLDLSQQLVAHLPFDGNGSDLSGRSNDATLIGSPSFATGRSGQALVVQTGKYASLPTTLPNFNADLKFGSATDFTVAFWVKSSGGWSGDPVLISNKNWASGSNQGWIIAAESSGDDWQWNFKGSVAGRADYDPQNAKINNSGWHLVVATHSRSGNATFYHDGVQIGSVSIANAGSLDTTYPINIGADGTGNYASNVPFHLDDLRIWRRALIAAEVTLLHAGAPAFTSNPITRAAATAGTAYTGQSIAGSATDPTQDTLTYSKVSGPAWLSIAANGSLTGTPSHTDIGANSFVIAVTDVANTATATLNIQVIHAEANGNGILDAWEQAMFGHANPGANLPEADADNDGHSNLMEFALNTHPVAHNASPIVRDLNTLPDGAHLRLTVPKNPAATNLTYTVEVSSDLTNWSSADTVIEANTSTQLIVRDAQSISTAPRRFIRLRVSSVP